MKHLNFLMALIAVSFVLFTGCQKEMRPDSMLSQNALNPDSKTSVNPSAKKLEAFKERIAKLKASLPADFQKSLQDNRKFIQKTDPQFREMVLRALKVEVACDDNTALFQWLDEQLADWDAQLFDYVFNQFDAIDLPFFYAVIYENSSANQYFGINGEYTQILTKTFKDLKRFWNIQTDDIVMVAMHGSTLRDREKLIKTYMNAFVGIDQELAENLADGVLALLANYPQLRNGDHPLFTFNSVSIPPLDFPGIGLLPPKIVMGDGIMQGFTAIGFGDVAPQAILAHEYGHQIQFQLGINTDELTAEASRETELMADAYSAYYLSHARGAALQWKRVKEFLQVFFNIGDCQITTPGHHGTPDQRMAAAEWAYNLANDTQKQGLILSSQQFTALFEAALPQILNH
jgi:hypothetical protein